MMDLKTDSAPPEITEIRPHCIPANETIELEISFLRLKNDYTCSQLVLMMNDKILDEIPLTGKEEYIKFSFNYISFTYHY